MKAIVGFDKYLVTESGEVINSRTGRVLKFDINSCGYRRVTLSQDSKVERFFVHRLVALHYLPNPSKSGVVNHKNGNKLDNNMENLEWCTPSENRLHAFAVGLCKGGEDHHNAKITVKDVIKVCELIQEGQGRGDVLRQVPVVSKATFDDIRRRKTWVLISKDFKW